MMEESATKSMHEVNLRPLAAIDGILTDWKTDRSPDLTADSGWQLYRNLANALNTLTALSKTLRNLMQQHCRKVLHSPAWS